MANDAGVLTPSGRNMAEAALLAAYNHGYIYGERPDLDARMPAEEAADWFYWHSALARESFLCGFDVAALGRDPESASRANAAMSWMRRVIDDVKAKSPRQRRAS